MFRILLKLFRPWGECSHGELGVLANDGIGAFRSYPWLIFFPAFFICLTMLAFNFLGDGLRDALDPRMRK
jgi:oligopeptide transport system permease protein